MSISLNRSFYIRRLISIVGLVTIFVTLILINSNKSANGTHFKTENRLPEEDEEPLKDGNNNIFFIEASGADCLRLRQACAIESAAAANPDFTINLYMASNSPPGQPEKDEGEGLERHCATMYLIQALPNVKIIRENLTEQLIGLPYLEFLIDKFRESEYSYQHISDAVRVALLYKYGGIYIDLDVVVLRSLRRFRNAVGHVLVGNESSLVENGLMAFDSGHKFLKYFMRLMYEWFLPDNRLSIGPPALSHAFRLYCKYPYLKINDTFHEHKCDKNVKLNLYNSSFFYAIGFNERHVFYKEDFTRSDLRLLDNSYSVHVYGSGHGAHMPEKSLYAYLVKKYCPNVYRYHEQNVYVF